MSDIQPKFFPIDPKLGYIQVTIMLDKEAHEELGDLDETLAMMSALQSLYVSAVVNFGGREQVDSLLHNTLDEYESANAPIIDGDFEVLDDD